MTTQRPSFHCCQRKDKVVTAVITLYLLGCHWFEMQYSCHYQLQDAAAIGGQQLSAAGQVF